MAIRQVLRMGHPILRAQAKAVEKFDSAELTTLIEDMKDTMVEQQGAGLAAPQIGVSQRVVIFGIEHNPRYPDVEPIPLTVLINPHIEILSDDMNEGWEGCLSVPGMRGLVPRYSHIRYSGFDAEGKKFCRDVSDFHARVVQHEVDHLDGILYPQRINDLRMFGFEAELFPED